MTDSVSFTVEGNPEALSRPTIGRGAKGSNKVWLRDPCKVKKQLFCDAVRAQILPGGVDRQQEVIIFDDTAIVVDIEFYIKAPKNHFINNDRGLGRLKPDSTAKWPKKPDIDNLDKFVLDSLQGFLFQNDSQVVKQTIRKVYHHQSPFGGQTKVFIRRAIAGDFGS